MTILETARKQAEAFDPKTIRRLVQKLRRPLVERLIKQHNPKAKPWRSNLPDLHDQLALAAYHDIELLEKIRNATDAPSP